MESGGTPAAEHVWYTLSFARARKQLGVLYGCGYEASWEEIVEARKEMTYEDVVRRCFTPSGIQTLLLDDLMIGIGKNCLGTGEHDRFVPSPVKRIIRIESVAEVS